MLGLHMHAIRYHFETFCQQYSLIGVRPRTTAHMIIHPLVGVTVYKPMMLMSLNQSEEVYVHHSTGASPQHLLNLPENELCWQLLCLRRPVRQLKLLPAWLLIPFWNSVAGASDLHAQH